MTTGECAKQIWQILKLAARNRQVLSFDILRSITNFSETDLRQALKLINSYCLLSGLPSLATLIINEGSGMPTEGFMVAQDVPKVQAEIFACDWLRYPNPSPAQFEASPNALPSINGAPISSTSDMDFGDCSKCKKGRLRWHSGGSNDFWQSRCDSCGQWQEICPRCRTRTEIRNISGVDSMNWAKWCEACGYKVGWAEDSGSYSTPL